MDTGRPFTRHRHLGALGVEPAFQGPGPGGAGLRPVPERPDAAGLPATAEAAAPRAVAFYRRHGFEVAAEALAATALGLGPCGIGAYFDDDLNRLLGVDGYDVAVVYLMAIGPAR